MKWGILVIMALGIGLALLLLLGYSLDRTSWLMSLYEAETPGTLAEHLKVSPLALGVAAAAVIEAGAVALIIADALGKLDDEIRFYVWGGLLVVLLVQGVANLLSSYLRGFSVPLEMLTAASVERVTAERVAWGAWAVSNTAIPILIFILSKLEARVIALALAAVADVKDVSTEAASEVQATPEPVKDVSTAPPQEVDSVPEIVKLKDREGLSFVDIGKRLGISRQAAQQKYRKALEA